jgi:hypothetical protein
MSNADYVNALLANAGVLPAPAERDSQVQALDTASESRASILLDVAKNVAFRQKETNSAFVLMQYFGYLRRDPAAAPDSDLSGYNFWVNKMNQFGGNYIDAEMIKAFITSNEYRQGSRSSSGACRFTQLPAWLFLESRRFFVRSALTLHV